ncbi:hypothetical protein [Kribbella solani]|uniref:Uncharacterized protein n=1 Tax=Kribbella solani TaxID=236067 RepID=A0A841DTJ2_9ACTN|nr:hypothetical protein [Kribbella solani]MBB5981923.1 hypothetical protein [Kribbella solani]
MALSTGWWLVYSFVAATTASSANMPCGLSTSRKALTARAVHAGP